MPYAQEFLTWSVSRFDCYWLTSLDRCGGNNRIRRAFRIAWNEWQLPGELEILFEAVTQQYGTTTPADSAAWP